MRFHFLFIGALCCTLFACKQEETKAIPPIDQAAFEREAKRHIAAQAKAFSAYFVAGNYDAMLDIYTPDAKIFPAGRMILSGQDLRNYWLPKPDATSKVIYHKVTPEELKILGNEAYDYGYYEGISQMEDGSKSTWGGKYVIVWKEVNPGVWKMYLDIWNSNGK